ncbi:unnamed protein product [Cylindrotheca closterium]|uniref:DNA ligase (NAD(+)) n=1 Tax=Cylindrotheca closterium TaxID=2856 RepID=A0AAD2CV86_9STRA|nr:unnamed protein product [Cylindrotheca closterium]
MLRARSALAFRAVPFLRKTRCKQPSTIRWLATKTDDETRIYDELKWLSSEIIRNDELYYNEQPILEDEEFDALVRRENEIKTQFPKLLKKLQKESGLGAEATRDGRVGSQSNVVERKKRKHLRPMLSLDNAHDEPQLLSWLNRVSKATVEVMSESGSSSESSDDSTVWILTEPKLDGVSLSLRYEIETLKDGNQSYELSWASTRGDGRVGQDVTEAVSSIPDIPKSLSVIDKIRPKKGDEMVSILEIRGEVVFPKTQFEALSTNFTFSNTRNAAAGILLRKPSEDPEEAEEAKELQGQLQFYAYDVVGDKGAFSNGLDNRAMMQEWGFVVPAPAIVTDLEYTRNSTQEEFLEQMNINQMLVYYESLRRHRLGLGPDSSVDYNWRDFDMDGCVHKVANPDIKQEMGRSMKSPNWAVAHKYPAISAVTELIDVIVQVGRTGALTPVAILKPVAVGGVNISRATLHNFDHMQEMLGNVTSVLVNTSVLVRRAGDVIPQVVSRVGDASTNENRNNESDDWISLETPKHCPACGSDVAWEETNGTAIGPVVRCTGPPMLCRPQAITTLAHAYSRDALDVTGLSESRIQQLMDADLLKYPADIFNYKEKDWERLQELPRWGPKSVKNLQSVTHKVATQGIPLRRFLYSLGLRHMGKHSSELVASTFGTKEEFFKAMDTGLTWEKPTIDEEKEEEEDEEIYLEHPFSKLNGQLGIGESVMSSLLSFAKNKDLSEAAKELASAIKILDEQKVEYQDTAVPSEGKDDVSKPWRGMRVVFTGAIPDFSRSSAHSAAKSLGAKATPGSVSKSTDLVVYGDKGGKKLKQAIQYGVTTMTAEEFIQLVKEHDLVD